MEAPERTLPLLRVEPISETPDRLEYKLWVRDRSPMGAAIFLVAAAVFAITGLTVTPIFYAGCVAFLAAAAMFYTLPVVRTRSRLTCDRNGVVLDGQRLETTGIEKTAHEIRFIGAAHLKMPLATGGPVLDRMVDGLDSAIQQARQRDGVPDPAVERLTRLERE